MNTLEKFVKDTLKILLVTYCGLLVSFSYAEDIASFPNKPIRLIVGFSAGGISDVLGRALASKLSNITGQGVIVENKPGAGTTIAAEYVSKSNPDGYTLFLQDMTTHAINVGLYKNLPYDSIKDFTPITLVASTPLMLVVNPNLKVNTLKEFIPYAKSKSDSLAYASSGNGTIPHLAAETFNKMLGINPVHVPFKGSSPATQAVLSGDVGFNFSTMPPALSLVQSKKLIALAVTTKKRVGAAPDVPTVAEAGLPGYEFVLYSGILGPKGMSPELVKKINQLFAEVVKSPEMTQVYAAIGAEPLVNSPAEFTAHMNQELVKMVQAVKTAGAHID
jgi:tripartite-type tricarboxylate transporter receptor subunit TctC